jgi:hypothetical protein
VPKLASYSNLPPHLGLPGAVQEKNAAIAVALCRALEEHAAQEPQPLAKQPLAQAVRVTARDAAACLARGHLPAAYAAGLQCCFFPGRSQCLSVPVATLPCSSSRSPAFEASVHDLPTVTFYLDGAHTPESMAACSHWFADASSSAAAQDTLTSVDRVLLFNCLYTRDPSALLPPLTRMLASGESSSRGGLRDGSSKQQHVQLQHAVFVPTPLQFTAVSEKGVQREDGAWQLRCADAWEQLHGASAGAGCGHTILSEEAQLPNSLAACFRALSVITSCLYCVPVMRHDEGRCSRQCMYQNCTRYGARP